MAPELNNSGLPEADSGGGTLKGPPSPYNIPCNQTSNNLSCVQVWCIILTISLTLGAQAISSLVGPSWAERCPGKYPAYAVIISTDSQYLMGVTLRKSLKFFRDNCECRGTIQPFKLLMPTPPYKSVNLVHSRNRLARRKANRAKKNNNKLVKKLHNGNRGKCLTASCVQNNKSIKKVRNLNNRIRLKATRTKNNFTYRGMKYLTLIKQSICYLIKRMYFSYSTRKAVVVIEPVFSCSTRTLHPPPPPRLAGRPAVHVYTQSSSRSCSSNINQTPCTINYWPVTLPDKSETSLPKGTCGHSSTLPCLR